MDNNEIQMEDMLYFKHDFINHMYVIKMYLEMGLIHKGVSYINRILDYSDYKSDNYTTGNTELDIVVLQKINKIRNIGTHVEVNCDIAKDIELDMFNLMTILGNLLDNCFEALINADVKELILDIEVIESYVYICVTNTHSNKIVSNLEEIATTKVDKKDHGIGLRSCRKCVEENGGIMEIYYDENDFNVDVKLPILNK